MKHRLIAGTIMAAIAGGVLFVDVGPYFPIYLMAMILLAILTSRELVDLITLANRPRFMPVLLGTMVLVSCPFIQVALAEQVPELKEYRTSWSPLLAMAVGVILILFTVELFNYRSPDGNVTRVAHGIMAILYLGLLGACFARIRWIDTGASGGMIALAIFVPKCGDVGAYFTGRFLGRHPMSPLLSPKKTWEGFCGGLLGSCLPVIGMQFGRDIYPHGMIEAIAFGLTVGIVGVIGDLAESLIKRDGQVKDASQTIPGFGGLLDVVDSVLFAAPVAYLWFSISYGCK